MSIITTDDIEAELNATLTSTDYDKVDRIRQRVESLAKKFVRHGISSTSYTHILPPRGPIRDVLQLPQLYLTAVAHVYEDRNARGGQAAGDFAAATELDQGTDWMIGESFTDFNEESCLRRINAYWPSEPHTVKVVYTAGLTADKLKGEFYFVKDALIRECVELFHYAKDREGASGSVGPVVSERLKDYAVSYSNNAKRITEIGPGRSSASGLLPETELALHPIMSYYDAF